MKNRLFLCLMLLGMLTLLLPSQSYAARNGSKKTFSEWCSDKNAPEKTKALVNQILRYSDTFNCTSAEQQLNALEELRVTGVFDDLSPLASLRNLKRLVLSTQNSTETNLMPLSEMKQLTHLDIIGKVRSIYPLTGLINLTYLNLGGNEIKDIKPIEKLTQLTYLNLGGNYISGDLAPLSSLDRLQFLRLSGHIADISPLSKLTQLEELHVYHSDITDISPLSCLTSLRILSLTRSPIRDIRPLSNLKSLVEVDLRETKIEDRTPLSKLPNLKVLLIDESLGLR